MTEATRDVLRLALELSPEDRVNLVQELVATLPPAIRPGVIPADLYETVPPPAGPGPTLRQVLREERDQGQ